MRTLFVLALYVLFAGTSARGESKAELDLEADVQKFNQQYYSGTTDQTYIYDYNSNPKIYSGTTALGTNENAAGQNLLSATQQYDSCVSQCLQSNKSMPAYQQTSICGAKCAQQYPQAVTANDCYQSANGVSVAQNCARTDTDTTQTRPQIEMVDTTKQ